MAGLTDELFLDIDEDGPGALGETSYFSFSETFEEPQYTHSTLSPDFDMETLTPTPTHGSPFSFESDHDLRGLSPSRSVPFWDCLEDELADEIDGLVEWEEILDAAASAIDTPPGGEGAGGSGTVGGLGDGSVADADVFGFLSERDILGVMDGIDSGDESIFSDEPPFDFGDDGLELDNVFQSVGWEVLPVSLDEDDFEVLPGHMVDVAAGGAPPAARAAVERLQVVAISGDDAMQGCAVCKDGITRGELATRLPCAHFYPGHALAHGSPFGIHAPCAVTSCPLMTPSYEQRRVRRHSAGGSVLQLGTPMQM